MGLIDEVEANTLRHGPPCTVRSVRSLLDKNEQAEFMTLVDNSARYPATKIAEVLRGRGHDLSDTSIRRHRRGLCACPR